MGDDTLSNMLGAFGESMDGGAEVVFSSNFAVNFAMTASLSHLWSLINGIQLPVYIPLFRNKLPGNLASVLSTLITVATFDLLPSDDMSSYFFAMEEQEPIDPYFG